MLKFYKGCDLVSRIRSHPLDQTQARHLVSEDFVKILDHEFPRRHLAPDECSEGGLLPRKLVIGGAVLLAEFVDQSTQQGPEKNASHRESIDNKLEAVASR